MGEFQFDYEAPINLDDIKEGLKADTLEDGAYVINGIQKEARSVEKGANKGRGFFRFTGTVQGRLQDGFEIEEGYKGRKVYFSASPEMRLNAKGAPDLMFKRWSQLVNSVGGGATVGEVVERIEQTPLRVRGRRNERTELVDGQYVGTGEFDFEVYGISAAA